MLKQKILNACIVIKSSLLTALGAHKVIYPSFLMSSEDPLPFFFYLPSWCRSFISYPAGVWLLLVRKSMDSPIPVLGVGGTGQVCPPAGQGWGFGHQSCYNGFPGSYPVIHGMTHGKLLGVTSLLWRQEWQVWSDWRASEPRVAMPVTWFSWTPPS